MRVFSAGVGRLAAAGMLTGLFGCGASAPSAPPAPTGPPVLSNTITITSAGANPNYIQVNAGDRVRFINNDARSHNMTSDPHPEHDACPELNQVGFLEPGQSRETGNLVIVETCGFHDHDNPDIQSLHGQIVIK
jgi:plastocyanin